MYVILSVLIMVLFNSFVTCKIGDGKYIHITFLAYSVLVDIYRSIYSSYKQHICVLNLNLIASK